MSNSIQPSTQRSLNPDEFRDVIGRFASGVTVITTAVDGVPLGTTASAVSSLSLTPPMVLICMNETSSTGQAIATSKAFAINILSEDQQDLAMQFASKSADKFDGATSRIGQHGQPVLDDALATLECRVVEAVRGGTHTVFLAEVDAATARTGAPLAYFRGQFGRLEIADDHGAYEAIRERILDGRLAPGQALGLQQQVDELSLPAGALQLALGKLTAEGLLVEDDGQLRVPQMTVERLEQGLYGRSVIELGVIDLVVPRLGTSDLDRLRSAHNAWVPVRDEASVPWEGRHAQSMDFHETLVSLAGIPALLDAYRQLGVPSLLARAFRGYALSEKDEAYGHDHDAILEALAAGDAERARQCVRDHTERVRTEAVGVLAGTL